jgi:hypothetical protein
MEHIDVKAVIRIEMRFVTTLNPYANNARTHSDQQIAQIAASIEEFGWTNPILIDNKDVVIAGHARLLAAKKLGMTEVPVIVLAHLTPAQRKALVLADNKLALNAGWDENLLRLELNELQSLDFDLDLTGFDSIELDELLRDPLPDERADEAPPLPAVATTRLGDLWICGEHRISCGDATEIEAIKEVLGDGLADMVFTDPPYSVSYTGKTAQRLTIRNDNLGAGFYDFLHSACKNVLAVTKGIARSLGIDSKTLRKHFRRELDCSADKADAQVAASLYKLAISGRCPPATIFWMKSRRGWRETSRFEHAGPDGRALLPIDTARALLKGAAASRPAEDEDEDPITN